MNARQPDDRVKREDLGTLSLNGKRYVTHAYPGCPRNAAIEVFKGYLRCWACKKPLTDRAARYVRSNAVPRDFSTETEDDIFIWKERFYHSGPQRRVYKRPPV